MCILEAECIVRYTYKYIGAKMVLPGGGGGGGDGVGWGVVGDFIRTPMHPHFACLVYYISSLSRCYLTLSRFTLDSKWHC